MVNAGTVRVTATDKSRPIDPIQRGESCTGIIEGDEVIWSYKEKPMGYSGAVGIPSHDPIGIVESKENRTR